MDQSRPLRFVLGYNHGGFLLKEDREAFLVDMGFRSEGFGTHFHASANDPNDVSILSNTLLREEYESLFAPPKRSVSQRIGFQTFGRLSAWNCSCGNVTGSYRRKCVVLEWENRWSVSDQASCKNLARNRAFKRGSHHIRIDNIKQAECRG